ncbi:MAG: adenosylcobinamide-GDP ribazoletransferase [Propionibacteriaceae bacterium]
MIRAFRASFSFFTIIPVPPLLNVDRDDARRAVVVMPWLGLILGALSAIVGGLLWWRTGMGFLAGITVLTVLSATTGAMHLDGIADTADGLGSRQSIDVALTIMKKSDIGPMGVATLVLDLLLGAALLGSLPSWQWLIVAALLGPAIGRASILLATRRGIPCIRPGGFGSLFAEVTPGWQAVSSTALLIATLAGVGFWAGSWAGVLYACAAAVGSLLVDLLWRKHLLLRLGGLTGDMFGSLVEVGQLAAWLILVIAVSS